MDQHPDESSSKKPTEQHLNALSPPSPLPPENVNEDMISVALSGAKRPPTTDQTLWAAIRNRTPAINFNRYRDFIDRMLCDEDGTLDPGPSIELQCSSD